ncbi:hypothetical protein RM531_09135 [Salinisphaera sp. P385]|uniref:Uncharacterized protein n=1 Tax=Spectribacter acetivorans TaxID=3075603 RepID=A0ABU3B849_9GAMM|nr:hypothetical protein [Salinisphaera sp. P385]MDT0618641.1 hypothetical protein [Salinisphaera sp. P385]
MKELISARNRFLVIFTAAFSAILCYGAYQAYLGYQEKVEQQLAINDEMRQFRKNFQALQSVGADWRERLPQLDEGTDVLTLFRMLGIKESGLTGFPDKARILEAERAEQGDVDIGAVNVCLATQSRMFELTAGNVGLLYQGLEKLMAKPFVTAESIEVAYDGKQPRAEIDRFCLYLRDPLVEAT